MSATPPHPLENLLYAQADLEGICAEQPLDWDEHAHMNDFYGNASVLKHYAGLPLDEPLPFGVEHAIPYDLATAYDYDLNSGLPMFLAVNESSAAAYRAGGMPAVEPVGSAYLYAQDLFRRRHPEFAEGDRRGTLVFPDKSTLLMETDFDRAAFASQLVSLPAEYQPVVVCIYWRDHVRGGHEPFLAAGLPVVSCGHLRDADFQFRLHDLCRRFRHSCANDLAGSFALSVLSGCHFFHLPTRGLTQTKHGVTTTYESDPTLAKPDKAACIAASPYPPRTPDAQRALVEQHAGVRCQRTPEEIADLYEQAQSALRKRVRPGKLELGPESDLAAFHGLLPAGVDRDGWARKHSRLQVPAGAGVAEIRFTIEMHLPAKSGQCIEARLNGEPAGTLRCPPWQQTLALQVPTGQGACVEFNTEVDMQLGNEARRRAFRIAGIELHAALPATGSTAAAASASSPPPTRRRWWSRIANFWRPRQDAGASRKTST
jgi:hypothetical protein